MDTPTHAPTGTDKLRFVWIDPDPDLVQPNPDNWRIHPQDQKAAVEVLIFGPSSPGWAGVALINDRQTEGGWSIGDARPVWINGHLRRELGQDHKAKIPALVGQWSPQAEALILATFDRVGDWAKTDRVKTENLLNMATTDSEAVLLLFAKLAKDAGLYKEWLGSDPNSADRETVQQIEKEQPPPQPPPDMTPVTFGRYNIMADPTETAELDRVLTDYIETRRALSYFVAREILGEDPQE